MTKYQTVNHHDENDRACTGGDEQEQQPSKQVLLQRVETKRLTRPMFLVSSATKFWGAPSQEEEEELDTTREDDDESSNEENSTPEDQTSSTNEEAPIENDDDKDNESLNIEDDVDFKDSNTDAIATAETKATEPASVTQAPVFERVETKRLTRPMYFVPSATKFWGGPSPPAEKEDEEEAKSLTSEEIRRNRPNELVSTNSSQFWGNGRKISSPTPKERSSRAVTRTGIDEERLPLNVTEQPNEVGTKMEQNQQRQQILPVRQPQRQRSKRHPGEVEKLPTAVRKESASRTTDNVQNDDDDDSQASSKIVPPMYVLCNHDSNISATTLESNASSKVSLPSKPKKKSSGGGAVGFLKKLGGRKKSMKRLSIKEEPEQQEDSGAPLTEEQKQQVQDVVMESILASMQLENEEHQTTI